MDPPSPRLSLCTEREALLCSVVSVLGPCQGPLSLCTNAGNIAYARGTDRREGGERESQGQGKEEEEEEEGERGK